MDMMTQIMTALMPVILAAIGYLGVRAEKWFAAKTRLELEAYHREALHSALTTGAQIVLARVRGDAAAEGAARGALEREVVEYVKRSVPDALAYLGASFDHLIEMAEGKLAAERRAA